MYKIYHLILAASSFEDNRSYTSSLYNSKKLTRTVYSDVPTVRSSSNK